MKKLEKSHKLRLLLSVRPSHFFFCPTRPQQTNKQNVLAAKALELFLQLVVDEASRVTASRGSKKVEAYHLCVLISHSHFTPILTLTLPPKETRDRDDRNARLSQGTRRGCTGSISRRHHTLRRARR